MQSNLDTKRLLCPMPVIRLEGMIKQINTGDTIQIIATDPGVLHDIPAWCKVHGHKVLACDEKSNEIVLLVEKTG